MIRKHMARSRIGMANSDTCGLCQTISSILKPVFCQIRRIYCAYKSLRCLDLKIWRFSCWWQMTDKTDCFTPCACARGKRGLQYSLVLRTLVSSFLNVACCKPRQGLLSHTSGLLPAFQWCTLWNVQHEVGRSLGVKLGRTWFYMYSVHMTIEVMTTNCCWVIVKRSHVH